MSLTNPYDVAQRALDAYVRRDLRAMKRITDSRGTAKRVMDAGVSMGPSDRIVGLYFQNKDTVEIAAFVRKPVRDEKAVYFTLVRSPRGFHVTGVYETAEAPDTTMSVEGH